MKKRIDWKRVGETLILAIFFSLIHYCWVNDYLDWIAIREIFIFVPVLLILLFIAFTCPNINFYYHRPEDKK